MVVDPVVVVKDEPLAETRAVSAEVVTGVEEPLAVPLLAVPLPMAVADAAEPVMVPVDEPVMEPVGHEVPLRAA